MDYISILKNSIDTSVDIKIFKNKEQASVAHIKNYYKFLES